MLQVSRGELALDHGLTLEQPVHRRIQIIFVRLDDPVLLGERRGVPPARGRKLRVRGNDARGHERTDAIALGTGPRGNEGLKTQSLHA